MIPDDEDAALASRVAAGEEEALQAIHRRYAPLVLHVARRALDLAAAEEVTQDVFLAVWRKAGAFDPAKGSLRTWIMAIARNRILDEGRARSRRPGAGPSAEDLDLAAPDPLPDEAFWRDYRSRAVAQALAALPESQRRALRLAYFADLSHEGVADALRIPLGTAKTRIRSGLRGMSSHLGALVAALLLVLGAPGTLLLRWKLREARKASRGLDLLANSSLQVLKLLPAGGGSAEGGIHAAWRSVPGRDLSVLTLSHVPPPPPGTHYVLWATCAGTTVGADLPDPDAGGKALQVLEGIPAAGAWPTRLEIRAETGRPAAPTGPLVVRWEGQGTHSPQEP